jgi:hypothetical protein
METQLFPESKELQDTVINTGVGMCLLGQRWNSACSQPGKGCNYHGKVLRCTSRQSEAATGLQTLRQALKKILFLQDNAAPHKAAITHKKLADLHSEVPKHPAYSPDLATFDYYRFPNLNKHLKG